MAENTGYMAPEEVNRLLTYLYNGNTFDEYIAEQKPEDEGEARKVWDETVTWMEENPLAPGEVWGTVPE